MGFAGSGAPGVVLAIRPDDGCDGGPSSAFAPAAVGNRPIRQTAAATLKRRQNLQYMRTRRYCSTKNGSSVALVARDRDRPELWHSDISPPKPKMGVDRELVPWHTFVIGSGRPNDRPRATKRSRAVTRQVSYRPSAFERRDPARTRADIYPPRWRAQSDIPETGRRRRIGIWQHLDPPFSVSPGHGTVKLGRAKGRELGTGKLHGRVPAEDRRQGTDVDPGRVPLGPRAERPGLAARAIRSLVPALSGRT